MEEISFKNISGLLVAEYDSIRVTRKHHTLYTEQEYFRFVVDFSGTFNVDPAECPDLVSSLIGKNAFLAGICKIFAKTLYLKDLSMKVFFILYKNLIFC